MKTLSSHIFAHSLWMALMLLVSIFFILLLLSVEVSDTTISSLSKLDAKDGISLEKIPSKYKKLFDEKDIVDKQTLELYLEDGDKIVYLYNYIDDTNKRKYVLNEYKTDDINELSEEIFFHILSNIIFALLIIFIILFFISRWLITRSAQPYKNLSLWVDKIQKDSKVTPKINFSIVEVNNIALQFQKKIDAIHDYATREEEFLKYTSHELRTPLTVIQASLDTLNEFDLQEKEQKPVKRALRASNNMRIISSALLYLARESKHNIKKNSVSTKPFIDNIVDDHKYLILNDKIQIQLDISVEYIEIEEELFFVIISNLIKNAFKHTKDGLIKIQLSNNTFLISNPISNQNENIKEKEMSFSLGLKLVELISKKKSYSFKIDKINDNFSARLIW